ncbi:hypothetical protein GCM10010168_59890 [Actinoplanes ianthinogenes]|uniref:Maltokinase N-terminal cap domain-containing protein n=1 Tax=Actinoplanes ianthinogenes TaxID=122358 RepID=A0ABM7M3W5_9ACTN|nr:hypothetical protein [Actinoplanes ianthinogenes]BCJ46350.1 hypothetical protein Aiant_70070 [Actinoplanes ianthinogenes]GGR33688.1 hypothetical protein GCM10010168_59890 [Actinoplanes ianthinogenes]
MALLHKADIRPTKLELLSGWLPAQSWYSGPSDPDVTRVAAGRLDDPAGAVGLEIMLVQVGDGPVLHTPLTYRGAPLDGADEFLIGTTEHSVLGTRWVYDAAGDPVFAAVLADVIRTGGTQAAEEVHGDGEVVIRQPSLFLRGSGSPEASGAPEILRRPGAPATPGEATLTGRWSGVDTPVVLARLTA